MKTQTEQEILNRLESIETLLKVKDDKPLNFTEASFYLSYSHSYLYKLTSKNRVPCHKPTGKYLFFFKDELDNWIAGRKRKRIINSAFNIQR